MKIFVIFKKDSFLKAFFLIALPLLSSAPLESFAQLDSIHYCPPIHSRSNGQISDHYIYLSTPVVTPFEVTIENGAGTVIATAIISKDAPTNVYLGTGQVPGTVFFVPRDSVGMVLRGSGFKAYADAPFYCNVRARAGYQATSIACKGLAGKGTNFYTGSMPQVISTTNRNFVTSIMATEDGTTVNIADYDTDVVFENGLGGFIYSDEMTVLLNEGDCFVFTGYTTTSLANMTGFIGAHITSNNPIVVNTGNYLGSISPLGAQDGGVVQIVPTSYLGTEHLLVEGGGGPDLEQPLVVGTMDGTQIYINDNPIPVTTINAGDYYLVPGTYYGGTLHHNMAIITSQPAYVFQNTAATTSEATCEFNFIPPLECYLSSGIDAIPDIDRIGGSFYDGKLYIITVSGATVSVNGAVIGGAAGPEPSIGLPGWETYKMDMTGDVAIESTDAMAAGFIAVNGFAGAGAFYAGFTFEFAVDAGDDLELCEGEPALLYGTGAGEDADYIWEDGVIDSVEFVPAESGMYYVMGSTFDGCESNDSVYITVFEPSISDAGEDQFLCDTNATTLSGSALTATSVGLWTLVDGPGPVDFDDPEEPDTDIEDLIEGIYTLEWAVTNGTCPPELDTVLIHIYNPPASYAGPDQDLCNAYSTTLSGSIPAGTATGAWEYVFGPSIPTIIDPTDPNTTIEDLVEGTYTMRWVVSNGVCEDSTDLVEINVFDLPVSDAGADVQLCAEYETNLNGNEPDGSSTGEWSVLSSPSAPTFDDATLYNALISDLEEGVYELMWTLSNGTCPPETDTVFITVYDMPISDAGDDASYCDTIAITLDGNIPVGTSEGIWTQISGTASIFEDETAPATNVTDMAIGDYTFVWTVSNGTCPSVSDTVEITILPYPSPGIMVNRTEGCAPLEVAFTNVSEPVGEDCYWEFGDGSFSEECGDLVHTFGPGTFDITLTITSEGCTSSLTLEDLIYVSPVPVADFTPLPTTIDITNTTVDFRNMSSDGTAYYWDFGDGSGGSGEFEPSHTYPEVIDGVYDASLIVTNELGCADTAYGRVAYQDLLIFYVPNAVTVDNTGFNDIFKPVFTSRVDPTDFHMMIFNRWGEMLFETYDLNEGWDCIYDGQIVQDGVYVWKIDFGDTIDDKQYEFHGHVTVLH